MRLIGVMSRTSRWCLSATFGFGCGGALGLDAAEQHAGGFVARVLRHQFASKGFGQDALGQVVDTAFG